MLSLIFPPLDSRLPVDHNLGMFRVQNKEPLKGIRLGVIGLLILSVAALFVTLWVTFDFSRELSILQRLIRDLPARDLDDAQALAGALRWQSRLTSLVVIQVIATAVALALLYRAYQSSQDSLRDIKALAGDILGSMDQAVFTVDLAGHVTSLNARAFELLALTGDQVGKLLSELTPQIDLGDFRNRADRSPDAHLIEDFSFRRNGRLTWLRTFCQPLRNAEGATIGNVLQMRDVTTERHVEDQVRRMERFMGLGSLAAGLHHEIKNPLAALSLHVQLLEEQLDTIEESDEVQQMLCVIKTEMNRVGAVLEGFRDFASVDQLSCQPLSIVDLIEQQRSLVKPRADRQGIQVVLQISEQLPATISADSVRVEQVLLNLMLNAIEAMPGGGELTITVTADGNDIRVAVSDTGSGISPSARDKIFDAYFTTKNHGTGMGLALSDKIIRQHGGTLNFSTSDHGTTFEFTLPQEPSTET